MDRTPQHGTASSQPVATPVAPPNVSNSYPYGYPTPYSGAYPPFIPPPLFAPYVPYTPFWTGSPPGSSTAGVYYGGYGYHDYYAQQAATHAFYPPPVPYYNLPYPPQTAAAENFSDTYVATATAGDDTTASEETVPQTQ
jgi:hypothetical protein